MILRTYIQCPACDAPILLRVGVARDRQLISAPCPECKSIIRGEIVVDGNGYPRYQIPGVKLLGPEDSLDWKVVSIYGDLPMDPALGGFSSGFLALQAVFGGQFEQYMKAMDMARWFYGRADSIEFAYGFYIKGQWDRLDVAMQKNFGDFWPDSPSDLQRHTQIHKLTFMATIPLDPGGMYAKTKGEIWSRTFKKSAEFSHAAFMVVADPSFNVTHRRIANQFMTLLRSHADWIAVLAIVHLRSLGRKIPESWQVPIGNFDYLRDAYRQNFELSCQVLHLVVRMQNIAEGRNAETIRDPADPKAWMPRALQPRDYVNNINQFNRSKAATKEAYLNRHPRLRYFWSAAFSRGVRNAIAHADFDYVAHDGEIIHEGEAVPFYTFLEALAAQIALLGLWLDLFKVYRVYASRWDEVSGSFLGF